MKTKILITVFTLFSFIQLSFSQKIKIKNNIATVDGIEYLKILDDNDDEVITNLSGKELIFIKTFSDTRPSAPEYTTYCKLIFIGQNKTIELKENNKKIVEILYKNKVIDENGNLVSDAVSLLVEKYGNDISPEIRNY